MDEQDKNIEARKAAYKAGPNGLRKREEAALSLRKQKRDAVLQERRGAPANLAENRHTIANAQDWETALCTTYKKADLLAGDGGQIMLLATLLDGATKEQKERCIPALLYDEPNQAKPVVLPYLVAQACSNPYALKALLGATRHVTSHDVVCAASILGAGYLNLIGTAVTQHASKIPLPWLSSLWDVVSNVALCSAEAQHTICQHPLMSGPFVSLFQWANKMKHGIVHNSLMLLLRTLITEKGFFVPPLPFMATMFPLILHYLMNNVQPMNWREMDPLDVRTLGLAADTMRLYMVRTPHPQKEEIFVPILRKANMERVFHQLCALCEAQHGEQQTLLVALLGTFSIFRIPHNEFHWAAHKMGVLRLLVQMSGRPGDQAVRATSFRALGNYVADDFGFVGPLVEAGIMSSMLAALKREQSSVQQQALYLLANLFVMCDDTRRHHMELGPQALAVMETLLVRERILNYVSMFIDVHNLEMTRDAIDILLVALQWNATLVMQTIGGEEAEDRIQQLIPVVKADAETSMYNQIVRIEELMDRGHNDAAFEPDDIVSMTDPITNDGKPFFF